MIERHLCLSCVAALAVLLLPTGFARSNLAQLIGRGGGRIRIGESWIDVSRRQVQGIIAELTVDELNAIQAALHRGYAPVAQDLLAAAALRYFKRTKRTI